MKNQLNNRSIVVRNILASAAFASILLVTSVPYAAHAADKKNEAKTPVEVKYLGAYEATPVFQLNIDNSNQEELLVELKDEDGSTLYSERVTAKNFSRKFRLNSELLGKNLTMSVSSKDEKDKQVFQIKNQTKVVEDVVVEKVR